jgi:adenylate kinase
VKIVFSGPPGCGKGTQAELLIAKTGATHYSTGDVFRDHIRRGTPIGLRALEYVNAGQLVPDEIVLDVARELLRTLGEKSVLFDGFPRTLPQAEGLDQVLAELGTQVDAAIFIDLEAEEIVRRLTSRRTCRRCGAIFNLSFKPPRESAVCDVCGGELYQRDDDQVATIRNRLAVYERETAGLKDYYQSQGRLVALDGSIGKDRLHEEIMRVYRARAGGYSPRGS